MQVEFGEAYFAEVDELGAYEELKLVIKGCLDTDFKSRFSALQVQRALFNIMQQRSWSHDITDAPNKAEYTSEEEDQGPMLPIAEAEPYGLEAGDRAQ